ncbi:MAG TPA: hypothetical protein VEN81_00860 [Planctomycetota bacterium]|nr:hypothetical protein [Planctomycetota bacterium]
MNEEVRAESDAALALIARQIEAARFELDLRRRLGEDLGLVRGILSGLRLTFLATSVGLEPRRDLCPGFALEVQPGGEMVLFHDGQPVPVFGPYVGYIFSAAGVDLEIGQSLLVEPELAKDFIEEALGRLAREQAWLEWEFAASGLAEVWERKIELVAASLAADALMERRAREAA